MLTFHIVTLFPEAFDSYLASSIIGRAVTKKKIRVKFYHPRDFVAKSKVGKNGYIRTDGRPYGGGPGMVIEAEPVLKAVKKAFGSSKNKGEGKQKPLVYFFDASGAQFTNGQARKLAKGNERHPQSIIKDIILICGHYEGVDARVQKILKAKKITVGPYTLTGGELPAMLVMDAVARQLPGVLGTFESIEEERVSSPEVYTRPEALKWEGKNYLVPKVLLSGNHKKMEEWKRGKRRLD